MFSEPRPQGGTTCTYSASQSQTSYPQFSKSVWSAGLVTGPALILAIGAQNPIVLRQGIRPEHVGVVVVLLCVAGETLLIMGARFA